MQNFQTFAPTNYTNLGAGIIFYLLLAIATFFSIANIFILIRYAKSRTFAFLVCLVYLIIFMSLVSKGISDLNSLT